MSLTTSSARTSPSAAGVSGTVSAGSGRTASRIRDCASETLSMGRRGSVQLAPDRRVRGDEIGIVPTGAPIGLDVHPASVCLDHADVVKDWTASLVVLHEGVELQRRLLVGRGEA